MTRRFGSSLGLRLACAALAAIFLSFVYGMNPWAIGSVEPWVTDLGRVECGADNTWQYLTRGVCPSIGYPEGSATANGLIIPQFAVILATVLPAQVALTATYALLIFLAICGAHAFFRSLGVRAFVAVAATAAWMLNPSVYGMRNFGSTFWGMLLLPAYLWVFSRGVARVAAAFGLDGSGGAVRGSIGAAGGSGGANTAVGASDADGPAVGAGGEAAARAASGRPASGEGTTDGRLAACALAAAATSLAATAAVKIDGYSYVMLMAAAGLVFAVGPLLRRGAERRWARSAVGLVIVGQAAVVSYAVHLATSTSSDWARAETDFFRSMGADLSSLVWPSRDVSWGWLTGLGLDTGQLWGDGTNNHWNYLGLATIVLLALGLVWARRGIGSARVWVLVGLVAFVLAMGPSLKIYDVQGAAAGPISVEYYLMPSGEATFTWPWQGMFTALPGLSTMRATYRWMALVRLAVIAVGALVVSRLAEARAEEPTPATRRRLRLAGAVAILAIVGTLPAVPRDLPKSMRTAESVASIRSGFSGDIDEALPDGALVVIASPVSQGNDFLAPLVSADSDITLYNTAGDKDVQEAQATWSAEVLTVVTGEGDWAASVRAVLVTGQAHAVVVPDYDMRWGIDSWPNDAYADVSRERVESLRQWPELAVERHEGFVVVTLAGDAG
ncbi:MAG: hypothetical protein Q3979_06995 [Actinomycetaceae bacterium]|nr:hypothetical protein [Actinomycetaceae bacterium]